MKHQIKRRYKDAVIFECELLDDTGKSMNTLQSTTLPTQAAQLAALYRASNAAALRAQIHLQNLLGGPF